MTIIPQGLLLLAKCIDLLTCHNLAYREPQGSDSTRAEAAARIVHSDGVRTTDTYGYYRVRSSHLIQDDKPVYYRVVVDGSELNCECQDRHMRHIETKLKNGESIQGEPMLCRHIIAASMVASMQTVFEE